ncbi:hypothetical protein [Anaerolentibacter hominis]|uniref:hypothetical protein n=1 Tax=Anaerolentibacter hominis TaxID=3079009 RepID=UPI0031B81550
MSLADISATMGSGNNRVLITESQNWTVPLGVHTIWISACAAGEDGSDSDPAYVAKAGEFILDEPVQVQPGQVIPITVGDGNTVIGDYFTLAKGCIKGNYPNTKLGLDLGYNGKPENEGRKGRARVTSGSSYYPYMVSAAGSAKGGIGGKGGYGGAFGIGGNGSCANYGQKSSSSYGLKLAAATAGGNEGNGGNAANTEYYIGENTDHSDYTKVEYSSPYGSDFPIQASTVNARNVPLAGPQSKSEKEVQYSPESKVTMIYHDMPLNLGANGAQGKNPSAERCSVTFTSNKTGTDVNMAKGGDGGAGGKGADATMPFGYGAGGGSFGGNGNVGNQATASYIDTQYFVARGIDGTPGPGGIGGKASKGAPGMVLIEW